MILKPDLRVPEQKTASLSFCDTSPKAFRSWADQLPMANTGEVSRQLYHAIIELNHLFLSPQQRLQFLELVREKIHFVCNELSRHYPGSPSRCRKNSARLPICPRPCSCTWPAAISSACWKPWIMVAWTRTAS